MVALILFGIFLGIILWHYWCVKWSKSARLLNLIPGPPTVPLFGNMLIFNVPSEGLWNAMREVLQMYKPISKLWQYSFCFVCLSDPDDIEVLLLNTKYNQKGIVYKYTKPWLNEGLVTSTGEKWHRRRKMLTPSFHFNILQRFLHTFIEEADYATKSLKKTGEPVVKDLMRLFSDYSLNTICATAMGTTTKDKGEIIEKYREAAHKFTNVTTYRYMRPWLHYDLLFNLTPTGIEQKKILSELHTLTNNIIQERKKYHESANGNYLQIIKSNAEESEQHQESGDNVYGTRRRKLALLDLLIAAQRDGNQIDDEGIKEEVNTFLLAGYDTTTTSLTFLFLHLAQEKEIQDRAREEANRIFSENGGKLTMSALQDMQYVERCIKEALRLHPTVSYITRYLTEDLQLKKYLIPAKTDILISIHDAQRNPKYWPNPEVFDPDRFLPENSKGRHPFAYIPFSAGPRNCIGQKYAMMEMKVITSYLLKNFYVECVDRIEDIRMTLAFIPSPAHPVYVKFIPIE